MPNPLKNVRESFGTRIFVSFGLLILVIFLSFGAFYLRDQRNLLREALVKEGSYLARNLAYNARVGVFAENAAMLGDSIEGVAQHEGVLTAAVFTRAGKLIREQAGGQQRRTPVPPPAAEVFGALELRPAPVRFEHAGYMEFWAPIILEAGSFTEQELFFGGSNVELQDRTIGFARVTMDKEVYGRKFKVLIVNSALLLAFFLLLSAAVTYLIVRKITRPLDRLTDGVRALEEGGFARVTVETGDEVGRLAAAFNGMVGSLEMRAEERSRAEDEIRSLNAELESRVRERTAELEEANLELESFNYSVSHDLRAPLVRIEGFCAALREDYDDVLDGPGRFCLERIDGTCRQMEQIIKAMMSLSRVGRGELRSERVDLSAMVLRVVDGLREAEPERRVTALIAPGVHAEGDARLVSQVVENLVGNAWKFTSGRPEALIEFGVRTTGKGEALFVRDNGVGFDMAYAERLFRPFERLHGPGEFPGTGVGLAIVRKIVERHAGTVWVESEEGRGTTVSFTLTGVNAS